jgi:hypothetical protein
LDNPTNHLMSGGQRKAGRTDIAFNGVEIGMTDTAADHMQERLARAGFRNGELYAAQRLLLNRKLLEDSKCFHPLKQSGADESTHQPPFWKG